MKRTLLFSISLCASMAAIGQTQIGNSDMEIWEDLGSPTEEPQNWSGIKSASGSSILISFAPQAITQSTDTRTGTGFCAKLETKSALGVAANGTMTCGRLNVGSAIASDPSNYSKSHTADAMYSEECADAPDSIVWWAKYTPLTDTSTARMKATLHDNYDYQDPEDATSSTHVVATAVLNYTSSNGVWTRYSVPFDYSGPASGNTHILVTFTTNDTPGGGDIGDIVLIDDVELIYNSNEVEDTEASDLNVYVANEENQLKFKSTEPIFGDYIVYDLSGTEIMSGQINGDVPFEVPTGVYIVQTKEGNVIRQHKVIKY